jgi:hypothetical protein
MVGDALIRRNVRNRSLDAGAAPSASRLAAKNFC